MIHSQSSKSAQAIAKSHSTHNYIAYEEAVVPRKASIRNAGSKHSCPAASKSVGKCEIRARGVSYVVPVLPNSGIDTVATTLPIPSFQSKTQHSKHVLKNVNAIFKPGTMTLVLGPPGCGKTTLLKHLAGILHVKGKKELQGSVTYNGCKANQVDLSSLAAYVQQSDNHYPTLTVKETFEFSHQCLVGKIDPNDPLAVNEQHMVDVLISELGLTECADTIIGDEMIRGVSGGQKRRVTVGEMMTGRATTLLLDEFSNGLDASTTYDIAKAVRTMAEVLEKTVVMTMLQPPPEVYDLFDNILVLDKGEVVYNGPRTTLPSYFRSIGFECPPRKDIADFLQEVTTHLGPRFATDDSTLTKRPRSPSEFAAAFESSSIHHALLAELDAPHTLTASVLPPSTDSPVRLGYARCLRVVFRRTWLASVRDKGFNIARLVQALVLGLIVGTTFLGIGRNTDLAKEAHLVPIKVSMFFLALTYQALTTISTIDTGMKLREVLYKQMAYHFFYPSAYVVSDAVVELVWTLPQLVLFGTPLYFAVGLHASAAAFATFFVVVYLCAATYATAFKFVTVVSPDAILAKVVAIFFIFLHVVFSGYVVPAPAIPAAWGWLFWTNPLAWSLRALVLNEFLASTPLYDTMLPNGQGGQMRVGTSALEAYGFSTNATFIGGGIVFLISAIVVLVGGATLAVKYVRYRPSAGTTSLEPADQENLSASTTVNIASHDINSLPFEPVTLSFDNLSYTIPVGKGKDKTTRQLLKGIHGCFQPGSLTALMGSTGAGKTTLMDVIAGRKTAGTIEGDMFVNGRLLERRPFARLSGYCEQTDVHEETSTIREAFTFSAALRLPVDTPEGQRAAFVEDILDVLELTSKANAQYLALTQGERKRVTIGVELLSNPSILFLDEPTTGLDSRAATIVMECIKRIAESGRTVVCTIHQPSTVLFELFDKLLLLKTGGELVYFGDLGPQSSSLLGYFGQFQGLAPMESRENPATYMLNCIGAGTGEAKIDVDFAAAYTQSALGQHNKQLIERLASTKQVRPPVAASTASVHVSFTTQFVALLRRQATTYWRSPSYNTSRLMLMVVVPLIFGSCFHGMQLRTSMDVVSQLTLIFVATSFLCIAMMTTSLPFVSHSRSVYYRERMSKMYSPAAYTMSLAVVEFCYSTVLAAVFVHVLYWLCSLDSRETGSWAWFWAFMSSSVLLWSFIGQLLVFWLPTPQLAELLGGGLASLSFVFSGFMIDVDTLAVVWRWVYWISPVHYMLEGIVMAQYNHQNATVVDVLTKADVAVHTFVHKFFNGTFSADMIGRNMVLLWVVIVVVQILLLRCASAINHTSR